MRLVEVVEIWQGLDLFNAVGVFKFVLFSRIAFPEKTITYYLQVL